jgi:HPt (histidine-containing phosphotransfer) domain-containing protein
MAYDPGNLQTALSAAVGSDVALIADLRSAFLESARRQADLLSRAAVASDWTMAALRLKGLCASFGVTEIMSLADQALESGPGDHAILRRIDASVAQIASES